MKNEMKVVNIGWHTTDEERLRLERELKEICRSSPFTSNGNIRKLEEKQLGSLVITTLRFTTHNNVVLCEYHVVKGVTVDATGCIYTGPKELFGNAEVGFLVGINERKDIAFILTPGWNC